MVQKDVLVVEFMKLFENLNVVLLIEYCGLMVVQFKELCNSICQDVEYVVVKNMLIKIVVNKVGIFVLDDDFKGLLVVVFVYGDFVVIVKVLCDFVKVNLFFVIKFGIFEGNVFIVDEVNKYVLFESCEVLLVKVVGMMKVMMGKVVVIIDVFCEKFEIVEVV